MSDRTSAVMGGKGKSASKSGKKSGGKKPHEIHVRHAKNGGYIAKHVHKHSPGSDPMDSMDPEEHIIPDMNQLQAHMAENMGDGSQSAPAAPGPAMGAPAPAMQGM